MLTVNYKGVRIQCETKEEAIEIARKLTADRPESTVIQNLADITSTISNGPWTRPLFWKFIENIGEAQNSLLKLLVTQQQLTDGEMRSAVGVDSNQELAGVLSGISKQAGALNVSARAVFLIENQSKSGKVSKTYKIATEFLNIATDQNWPSE